MSYPEEMSCRKCFLDFYASEINTHGRLIIGVSVIIFTLLQARLTLQDLWIKSIASEVSYPVFHHQLIVIYIGVFLASFAFWYLFLRLLAYGLLADMVIRAPWPTSSEIEKSKKSITDFFALRVSDWAKKEQPQEAKNPRDRRILLIVKSKYFTTSTRGGFIICSIFASITVLLVLIILNDLPTSTLWPI